MDAQRPAQSDGSRTLTVLDTQPLEGDIESHPSDEVATVGALRLRGRPRRNHQRVAWGDSVVDNEGCGKKKSKSEYFDIVCLGDH